MALTYSTMQAEVANRLRLDITNDANLLALVKRWLNLALQKIHSRADWQWDEEREIVATVADKTDGTVSISASGTTVTGSSTAFASTDVGKFIQFSSSNDWYKITAVASSTSLTIESGYVATSALSAGTYTIRKFYYATGSTAEKILSICQAISKVKLRLIHFKDFDESLLFQDSTGDPLLGALWGIDSNGYLQFAIYPYPDSAMNLEVRFKKTQADLSADSDEPRIPNRWRWLLIESAVQLGLEYVRTDGNDKRAEMKAAEVERGLQSMEKEASVMTDDYHPVLQSRETRGGARDAPLLPTTFDWRQR